MQTLDILYNNPPENLNFIDRKVSIGDKKSIIYGPINSGKTHILIDYLSRYKKEEILYVNLKDLRVNEADIFLNILNFIELNTNIRHFGIDNLSVLDSKKMSIIKAIFENKNIISFIITTDNNELQVKNMQKLHLNYLFFEEFIAFDKKKSDINALLSDFLIQGNGAKNSFLNSHECIKFEQNILSSNFNNCEVLILKECSKYVHQKFSTNQIYTFLKEKIKISKDTIYKNISEFENRGIIKFLPKYNDLKCKHKLYFSDFLLKDSLSLKKDFQKKFTNALFCELLFLNENIYYTDEFDFYIPSKKMGILVIPFSASEIIFLKFKKLINRLKELKITKLNIISMANSGDLEIEGIKCEVLPFSQFALSF